MSRKLKTAAVTVAAGAAVALGLPATQASAMNLVDCGDRTDFVRVTENFTTDYCYANAGSETFGVVTRTFWASKISTGNNDITWWADGNANYLARNYVITWPTVGTVRLDEIDIH